MHKKSRCSDDMKGPAFTKRDRIDVCSYVFDRYRKSISEYYRKTVPLIQDSASGVSDLDLPGVRHIVQQKSMLGLENVT